MCKMKGRKPRVYLEPNYRTQGRSGWCDLDWLSLLPENRIQFPTLHLTWYCWPSLPDPRLGVGGSAGGYQEGSRTQVSFLVPASAAFAAVFTAFQCPAKGTVFRLSAPAGQTQTPDTLARPPFLFMGERVCCGTWWVGTVSRVYKGTGRKEGRENGRYCEPKSRTTM